MMTPRQAAQLALGVTGIWALIYAISGFAGIIMLVGLEGRNTLAPAFLQVAPSAVLLVLGYVLVFHNAQAASVVFPDFGGRPAAPPPDLSRLLVALTGVLIFASALPGLMSGLMSLLTAMTLPRALSRPSQIQSFAGRVVEAGFGLYLVMRPQWLLAYVSGSVDGPLPDPAEAPEMP